MNETSSATEITSHAKEKACFLCHIITNFPKLVTKMQTLTESRNLSQFTMIIIGDITTELYVLHTWISFCNLYGLRTQTKCSLQYCWKTCFAASYTYRLSRVAVTNACIYFRELKNCISPLLIFANGKVLKISSLQISAPKNKELEKDSWIKEHSAVSVRINGETGRSRWKNCCYWLILRKAW